MKKILLLLSLSFVFFACSSDDDSVVAAEDVQDVVEGDEASQLLGTWSIVSRDLAGFPPIFIDSCVSQGTIVFTEEQLSFTLFFDNGDSCEEFFREGPYTIENGVITADGVVIEEFELTASQLEFDYSIDIDLEGNGDEVTFSGTDVYEM